MIVAPDTGVDQGASSSINAEDVPYFRTRACSPSFAAACGARSVDANEARLLLGYSVSDSTGGIAFIYRNTHPPFVRVRLHDGQYLTRAGIELPIFLPLGKDLPDENVVVVESPTKAIALAEAGFHAVGLGGVNSCLTKDFALNSSWSGVRLQRRRLTILFDSDQGKPVIARALARLARALHRAGGDVEIARLPESEVQHGA